jgi:protease II
METKLTLSLDKEIIEQAKKYAKKQRTSLSKIVENYFYYLTLNENKEVIKNIKKTPITDRLLGSVKLETESTEKLKEEYLMDKYINV